MRFQRCTHSLCARPFQVNEFPVAKAPGCGEIVCPHCGHRETASPGSVFLVHAMLPEQEAQFEAEHPLASRDKAA